MNRTSATFWTLTFKISSFVCIAYESQQNNGSCVAPYVRMLIAFSDFTEERGFCTQASMLSTCTRRNLYPLFGSTAFASYVGKMESINCAIVYSEIPETFSTGKKREWSNRRQILYTIGEKHGWANRFSWSFSGNAGKVDRSCEIPWSAPGATAGRVFKKSRFVTIYLISLLQTSNFRKI